MKEQRKIPRFLLARIAARTVPGKSGLLLTGLVSRVLLLAVPVLFGELITRLGAGAQAREVCLWTCAVLAVEAVSALVSWANERLSNDAFCMQERRLKERVWTHIESLPTRQREASSEGVWLQKLSRDVVVVQMTSRLLLDAGLGFVVFFLGTFLLVARKAPLLSLVFVAMAAAAWFTHRRFAPRIASAARDVREACCDEGDSALGLLAMMPVLGLYGVLDRFRPLFLSQVDRTIGSQRRQQRHAIDFRAAIQFEVLGVHAVLLLACTWLFLEGGLAIGDIVTYDILVGQVLGGLSQLVFALPQIRIGQEYARSLAPALGLSEDGRNDGRNDTVAPAPARAQAAVPQDPAVAFDLDSVTFRYRPDGPPVLRDFTARIRKGEFVCFLGRNGTGKSTLAKLLVGAYAPCSGRLRSADPRPGLVPQQIIVHRDSLLENVRLRDETIATAEVEAMLRECGLGRCLDGLPEGLSTVLAPGRLSGGELQTLGIVRALVRQPRTLIVDELTNNLDIVAKESVYALLSGLRGRCTLAVITHDVSCIGLADRVFVFRREGIVEVTGHDVDARTRAAQQLLHEEAVA